MIKKDNFCKAIDLIKDSSAKWDEFNKSLDKINPDFYNLFYPTHEYDSFIVNMLRDELNLPLNDDIIEWWMYETNFGASNSEVEENGKTYNLTDSASLYDFICRDEYNNGGDL